MADSVDKNELIANFSSITGVPAERAQFYLESAGWKLDIAMGSFYEDDDAGAGGNSSGDDVVETQPKAPEQAENPWPAQPKAKPRFGTLSSMQQDDGDSSEEEGQAFYAGGSEHGGGQQVLGPPRKKQSSDDFIQNMFKSAKEHGAEVAEEETSTTRRKPPTFKGTGYRLGETEEASDVVHGQPVMEQPKQVDVVLKLWKNGFSVDDGALRDFRDPANKEFLESIHKGEVPRELIRMARGGEVNLNMEDHRTEEFVAPKVKVKAFSGEGHTLGSPAPSVAEAASVSTPAQSQSETVKVDESQPTTNLQIRLADGSRMVAKFNHSHKVADVRSYILGKHPEFNGRNFVLMTTFPNKELTDETQTLQSAGLLNAVLVQRMK